ncbi:TPA: 3-methyl-2-oxobutanoate dehydrogenase subunit beta, partial [Candidatus Acetothermia bacterium]|nr:3-methyl-2-oxobutanoate dehydrogenase subunit beta [Candidatus Acetothermia bacterium]
PGLGNIAAAQGDYFQATKGGGHGDYRLIVFGPATVQEAVEQVVLAFDISDQYRVPTMILADGLLGQMMEPVSLPTHRDPATLPAKPWALTGAAGRPPNYVASFALEPWDLRDLNLKRHTRYKEIEAREVRWEEISTKDAEILLVAYGTMGRIAKTAVRRARADGIKAGLLRPITLWPFPYAPIRALSEQMNAVLTVEMSAGQMWEDVRLAVEGRAATPFYGEMGGVVPTPSEILQEVTRYVR